MSTGGVEWELRAALDQIASARIAGDFAAESLGWVRFSDGLRNATGSVLAQQLIPMLLELQTTHDERRSDAASFEHNIGLLLSQAEVEQAELGRHAARLGLAEAAALELSRVVLRLTRRVMALEAAHRQTTEGAESE